MSLTKNITDWKQSYWGLRLRELLYRRRAYTIYPPDREAMKRYRQCQQKKPFGKIQRELRMCQKYWKCYPFHYFRYNMYRADNPMSEADMLNYLPDYFFYAVFLPCSQSRSFGYVFSDKALMDAYMRGLGLPLPVTVAKTWGGQLYNRTMDRMGFRELVTELQRHSHRKVFVKPNNGEGGHGIYVFNWDESRGAYTSNEQELTATFIDKIAGKANYVLQIGVVQIKELADFAPNSVNTCRVATCNIVKPGHVVGALFRMGVGGMEVDNADSGGIYVKVDAETGELWETGRKVTGAEFSSHPETGIVFKGFRIPQWPEIKEFVRRCAEKVPEMGLVGWDVAVTLDGPVLVEANNAFGLVAMQTLFGGLRERLGIEDPDHYWRNFRNGSARAL